MNAARLPKVAGISPLITPAAHTAAPQVRPVGQLAAVQDRLASWISDLTTLHELTERLVRTTTLDSALNELVQAGAALVGAPRGLAALQPTDHLGPDITVGLGLGLADLGAIETVPLGTARQTLLTTPGQASREGLDGIVHADLPHEPGLDPRLREVAACLGFDASYSLPLASDTAGHLGTAVWFYDEPAEPDGRRRHLAGLYCRYAAEHLARLLELARARTAVTTLRDELLPARLPRVPGVRLAARHRTGPRGGGDWYDALPLPEGAIGLSVGGVTGSGPGAVAAMCRLRASLRAYAVMEGEDPVAVLSDLELLLRLTEPARSATALFVYAEPGPRRIVLAGAGHCPPLILGSHRAEYIETTLSAPLGMLACWEAPSVEFDAAPGDTLLLYTDGLLHRTGDPMDRAFGRLHSAAAGAPRSVREDPDQLVDHVLHTMLPDGSDNADSPDDVVLLAARFE
ncbi:MAG: hypothetical protein QOI83_4842 [Streptomycetaceae bacterium]|nr:hypothetical protein [Streptomycetaceae bacterium]